MSIPSEELSSIKVRITLGPALIDLEAPEDNLVRVVGKLVVKFAEMGIIPPLEDIKKIASQEGAKVLGIKQGE